MKKTTDKGGPKTAPVKEVTLTDKQFKLIKELAENKASLQAEFQKLIKQEQDLVSLILDFNNVDENVNVTGITEDKKLKYIENA